MPAIAKNIALALLSTTFGGLFAQSLTNSVAPPLTISLGRRSDTPPSWVNVFVSDGLSTFQGRLYNAKNGQGFISEEELKQRDFTKALGSISSTEERRMKAQALLRGFTQYRTYLEGRIRNHARNPKRPIFEREGKAKMLIGDPRVLGVSGDPKDDGKIYVYFRMNAGKDGQGQPIFESIVALTKSTQLEDLVQAEIWAVVDEALQTSEILEERLQVWSMLSELKDELNGMAPKIERLEMVKGLVEKGIEASRGFPDLIRPQVEILMKQLQEAKSREDIEKAREGMIKLAAEYEEKGVSIASILRLLGVGIMPLDGLDGDHTALKLTDLHKGAASGESPQRIEPESGKGSPEVKAIYVLKKDGENLVMHSTEWGPKIDPEVIVKGVFKSDPLKVWSLEEYSKLKPELFQGNDPFSDIVKFNSLVQTLVAHEEVLGKMIKDIPLPKR